MSCYKFLASLPAVTVRDKPKWSLVLSKLCLESSHDCFVYCPVCSALSCCVSPGGLRRMWGVSYQLQGRPFNCFLPVNSKWLFCHCCWGVSPSEFMFLRHPGETFIFLWAALQASWTLTKTKYWKISEVRSCFIEQTQSDPNQNENRGGLWLVVTAFQLLAAIVYP